MRNLIFRLTLMLSVLMFACAGCDNFLTGLGAGAAGTETLQSWKENLEAKKAELQEKAEAIQAVIESTTDPNTLVLAKKQAEEIRLAQLANESALLTVQAVLDYPKEGSVDDRKDFFASVLIGGGALIYEWLTKRKLNNKYVSMKEGQATFEADEPDAGKKLYTAIGIARRKRGL